MEAPIAALRNSLGTFVQEITKSQSKASMTVIPFSAFDSVLDQATRPGYIFNELYFMKVAALGGSLNDPSIQKQHGVEFANGIGIARHLLTPTLRGAYQNIKTTNSLEEAKNIISSTAISSWLNFERGLALGMDYFGYLEDTKTIPSASQIAMIFLTSEDSILTLDPTNQAQHSLFREDATYPKFRASVNPSTPRDLVGYYRNPRTVTGKVVGGDSCNGAQPTGFRMKKFCTPITARTNGSTLHGKTYQQVISEPTLESVYNGYCHNTTTGEGFFWPHYPTVQSCLLFLGKIFRIIDGIGQYVACAHESEPGCIPDTSVPPQRKPVQTGVMEAFIADQNSCQPLVCDTFMKQAYQSVKTADKLTSIVPMSCPERYSIENEAGYLPFLDRRTFCSGDMVDPVIYNQNEIVREGQSFTYQDFTLDVGVSLNANDYASKMQPWLKAQITPAASSLVAAVSSGPEPQSFLANGQGFVSAAKEIFAGKNVVVHGIVGLNDTPCSGVSGEFSKGTQYLEAVKLTNGASSSVCDANYDGILSKIGQDVFSKTMQEYPVNLAGKKIIRVQYKDTKVEIPRDQYELLEGNTVFKLKFTPKLSDVLELMLE